MKVIVSFVRVEQVLEGIAQFTTSRDKLTGRVSDDRLCDVLDSFVHLLLKKDARSFFLEINRIHFFDCRLR